MICRNIGGDTVVAVPLQQIWLKQKDLVIAPLWPFVTFAAIANFYTLLVHNNHGLELMCIQTEINITVFYNY